MNLVKNIKSLMLFNLLFYANNFLLIAFTYFNGLKGLAALWFFTPFIFLMFTTHMIEVSRKKISSFISNLSKIEFILRCMILVINFLALSEIIGLTFTHLIALGFSFLAVNIFLEWMIYRRVCQNNPEEENSLTNKELNDSVEDYTTEQLILKNKSPREKEEIHNAFRSIFFTGVSYLLILLLVGGGIFAFGFFGEQHRIKVLTVALILMGVYFYVTNRKLTLFFQNDNERKKINFRDNITFIIGISIIYYLQGYLHIGTGTFNFLGIFLATFFFIPTIKTNQLIRMKFHKVNKKYLSK